MRIVISGGSGFIGRHVAKGFIANNHDVIFLIRKNTNRAHLQSFGDSIRLYVHDNSASNLVRLFTNEKPDLICHLAAKAQVGYAINELDQMLDSNFRLGLQIIDAMRETGVRFFINTATPWQYSNGKKGQCSCLYAALKEAFDGVLDFYTSTCEIFSISLVLADVYGPRDDRSKLFSFLLDSVANNKKLEMSPGEQKLSMVHISDVVDAFILGANLLSNGSIKAKNPHFSVHSDEIFSLKEVVSLFEAAYGNSVPVVWGGRDYRSREFMEPWVGEKLPGWFANVPLVEGIRGVVSDYKEFGGG